MRVATLYDVEGNIPALEAVLAELENVRPDAIVFGGDLFCGVEPVEVIDRARSLPTSRFLLGNADRLDEPDVAYSVALLRQDQRDFIATFPEKLVIGDVLYRHGSPRSVDELVTVLTPDGVLREMLEDGHVELRRTDYDVDAAIQALAPDDPNRERREQWIRGPHDPNAIAQQIETALGRARAS